MGISITYQVRNPDNILAEGGLDHRLDRRASAFIDDIMMACDWCSRDRQSLGIGMVMPNTKNGFVANLARSLELTLLPGFASKFQDQIDSNIRTLFWRIENGCARFGICTKNVTIQGRLCVIGNETHDGVALHDLGP